MKNHRLFTLQLTNEQHASLAQLADKLDSRKSEIVRAALDSMCRYYGVDWVDNMPDVGLRYEFINRDNGE